MVSRKSPCNQCVCMDCRRQLVTCSVCKNCKYGDYAVQPGECPDFIEKLYPAIMAETQFKTATTKEEDGNDDDRPSTGNSEPAGK